MTSITRAESSEIEAVLELVRAYYEFDGIPCEASAVRRGLGVLLADASLGGAWLVRNGDALVGYFVLTFGFDLEFGGRRATVTDLFVSAGNRRRGFGSAMLRFIEDHLAVLGVEACELQVEADNADARAFYESVGFVAYDRIPMCKRIVRTG
jgi:diamine N-acetyltransferase